MKMTNNDVKELFDRYVSIENEIKLLQEDKKQVLAEFKDRVEPKVFKAALTAARNKAKLRPHETNDYDQVVTLLEGELCVDHLD
jgi:quercetin dioxygenase-like cupin family protein